ncbi:sialidase family protein [Bacteroidota bacterium]
MRNLLSTGIAFLVSILIVGCGDQPDEQRYWDGLIGAYYGDPDLTNIKFPEVLHSLENEWDEETGHGSAWSGQYEGFIISPVTGELTIHIETNKVVEFNIDGFTGNTKKTDKPVMVSLISEKDQKHHIIFSFLYTKGDPGSFKFSWSWDGQAKTVIPTGNFVFNAEQSEMWNWIPEPDPASIDFSKLVMPSDIQQGKVFYEEGKFAGWPANGGIWNWGDEIVVNFTLGYYKEILNHHSIDESKPSKSVLARSTDGGETWNVEGEYQIKIDDKEILPAIDFSHPDLAMKVFRNSFIVSYDRCKTWQGMYPLPDFGYEKLTNRTDYILLNRDECIFFFSYEDKTVQARLEDKAFASVTKDGGKTFEKLGEMCPDDNYRAVMPSSVKISEGHYITTLRRRFDERFKDKKPQLSHNWIDAYESKDGGVSWQFLSRVADTDMGKFNGNPPCLVKLKDGRLCVTYGYRAQPYGIRAKLSSDDGKTWGDEIHLRNGAREFDLGYSRSVQRADGKIVTTYYFNNQEVQEQFIEYTIWNPNSIDN